MHDVSDNSHSLGDASGEKDLVSPLQGKSLPRIVGTIVVAIVVPGGLYLLAALVLIPLITRMMLRRVEARRDAGEMKKALANANRAVRLSRKSATALAHRGLVHLQGGGLDAALADAEEGIERKPKVALPYYVRARVHEARGDADAARADYVAFLDRLGDKDDPRDAPARISTLGE